MKSTLFIAIVLISGALAGAIHGTVNFAIVEPYLDQAIGIENQNLFASGGEDDNPQFWAEHEEYRVWQKSGQVLAGMILGIAMGSLFGIVYALSRNSLPGKNDVSKAVILAGIMWVTIYLIPFLKYPANPPTIGDADTVVLRGILYLSFIAISGFSAVGFSRLYKKFENKKYLSFLGYAVFITSVFFIIPPSPDEVTAPMDLVNGFRIMYVMAVTTFWIAEAIIL